MQSLAVIFYFLAYSLNIAIAVDNIVTPNAVGKDVVEAVIQKIRDSKIFDYDKEFLERVAYVESKYGNARTYSQSNGGIWKVSDNVLYNTQDTDVHPTLDMMHMKLLHKFGIDWLSVDQNDLNIPLYSGIATQLFLQTLPSIPSTIEEQAKVWSQSYSSGSSATTFKSSVDEMHNSFKCKKARDQCILLDASGSINRDDFKKEKKFAYNTINMTNNDLSRHCVIVYSRNVTTRFRLDNALTRQEQLEDIEKIPYFGESTNTGGAIKEALNIFKTSGHNQSPCHTKSIFVLTDGQNNEEPIPPWPQQCKDYGIIMNAIGVGPHINKDELLQIANGNNNQVDHLDNFVQLSELAYKFNKEVCNAAVIPPLNQDIQDSLSRDEKRIFKVKLNKGISVVVKNLKGKHACYYSYTIAIPSSAQHDETFTGSVFIPKNGEEVYITVEGKDNDNDYSIYIQG